MPTTNILDLNNRLEKLEKKPGGAGGDAEDIGYDPTASGLQATNVQDAIDEVSSEISGMSADDVTYDNTDSGLSSETVQGAIDETVNKIDFINDDLNGFKFYPVGTAIVGLVSDDSPYTDANGNYILAASTTGQSMIDDVTYKSINSTIDARGKVGADTAAPFKSETPAEQNEVCLVYHIHKPSSATTVSASIVLKKDGSVAIPNPTLVTDDFDISGYTTVKAATSGTYQVTTTSPLSLSIDSTTTLNYNAGDTILNTPQADKFYLIIKV